MLMRGDSESDLTGCPTISDRKAGKVFLIPQKWGSSRYSDTLLEGFYLELSIQYLP